MNKYPIIPKGLYRKQYINKIPFSYVVWYFDTIAKTLENKKAYFGFLNYFFSKTVYVKKHNNKYNFIFSDYRFRKPPGIDKEFLSIDWGCKNSKGEYVYEFLYEDNIYFISLENGKYAFVDGYVSVKNKYSYQDMIYELNNDYYFYDEKGIIHYGAYLLREPYIPINNKENAFKNIKINETITV